MNDCNSAILGFETSSKKAGIALQKEQFLKEKFLSSSTDHARHLLPTLDELLKESGTARTEISLIAVGVGPGSYTGLRVGVATVLTLALAGKIPLVAVSSLTAIAAGVPESGNIAVLCNAYGGEIYAALFTKNKDSYRESKPVQLISPKELKNWLPSEAYLVGDAIPLLDSREFGSGWKLAPEEFWFPRPATVLQIGRKLYTERGADDPHQVRPLYLRPSRAEIQKNANSKA